MVWIVLLLVLLNGDFSNGLAHWNAAPGWSAGQGTADFSLTAPPGNSSRSAVLCSDEYALQGKKRIRGAASIFEHNDAGYVVPGVRWFDANGQRMTDYLYGYDHHAVGQWVRVGFDDRAPRGARFAAFCFFAAAYAGGTYTAQVDNASWR